MYIYIICIYIICIYIYIYNMYTYIYNCTYVQLFWGNASIWHTYIYIYIVVKMLRLWLINLAVHVMQYKSKY